METVWRGGSTKGTQIAITGDEQPRREEEGLLRQETETSAHFYAKDWRQTNSESDFHGGAGGGGGGGEEQGAARDAGGDS